VEERQLTCWSDYGPAVRDGVQQLLQMQHGAWRLLDSDRRPCIDAHRAQYGLRHGGRPDRRDQTTHRGIGLLLEPPRLEAVVIPRELVVQEPIGEGS